MNSGLIVLLAIVALVIHVIQFLSGGSVQKSSVWYSAQTTLKPVLISSEKDTRDAIRAYCPNICITISYGHVVRDFESEAKTR